MSSAFQQPSWGQMRSPPIDTKGGAKIDEKPGEKPPQKKAKALGTPEKRKQEQ